MNLKPNLWTLLFVLATGGLLYTYSTNNDGAETAVNNPCNPSPDEAVRIVNIPKSTFDTAYQVYQEKYLSTMQDTSLHLDSLIGVNNLAIQYYKLSITELEQMYCDYLAKGKPEVYVYPVIQQDAETDSLFMDLVFAMSDERGATSYFDFTAPCPTLCDE